MKKGIIGLFLLLTLVGCAPPYVPSGIPTVAKTSVVTTATAIVPNTDEIQEPVYGNIDVNKVSPGSFGVYGSLVINNYIAGVKVDKNTQGYQPLYIINRINKVTENKNIWTDKGETVADIPIRRLLHNGDINNVIRITSDLVGEQLKVEKYNQDGTLTISGFMPESKRLSSISYIPDSQYNVSCAYDSNPEKGYSQAPVEVVNWVTFDQTSIIIPPDKYAPVWVSMSVPKETVINLTQVWYLTVSGEARIERIKKEADTFTDAALRQEWLDKPENKLFVALKRKSLSDKEIVDLDLQDALENYKNSGDIALSSDKKWEFWVEIQLSSGVRLTGVATEIVYRVGVKVDMRQ